VHRCFLWRVSPPIPACFLAGGRFILVGRGPSFLPAKPSLFDNPGITVFSAAVPVLSIAHTDRTGHGTHREATYLGILGGIYTPGYTGRHTHQGIHREVPHPGYTGKYHTQGIQGAHIPPRVYRVHIYHPGYTGGLHPGYTGGLHPGYTGKYTPGYTGRYTTREAYREGYPPTKKPPSLLGIRRETSAKRASPSPLRTLKGGSGPRSGALSSRL